MSPESTQRNPETECKPRGLRLTKTQSTVCSCSLFGSVLVALARLVCESRCLATMQTVSSRSLCGWLPELVCWIFGALGLSSVCPIQVSPHNLVVRADVSIFWINVSVNVCSISIFHSAFSMTFTMYLDESLPVVLSCFAEKQRLEVVSRKLGRDANRVFADDSVLEASIYKRNLESDTVSTRQQI